MILSTNDRILQSIIHNVPLTVIANLLQTVVVTDAEMLILWPGKSQLLVMQW